MSRASKPILGIFLLTSLSGCMLLNSVVRIPETTLATPDISRSVVIFGQAELITDEQEAWDALEAFTEHVIKGRWAEVREPDASEMKKTMVLAFSLEKASAKVRVGNPSDDEEDYELPVWAGVLPLKQVAQAPITDPLMRHQTPVPDYVANYSREK